MAIYEESLRTPSLSASGTILSPALLCTLRDGWPRLIDDFEWASM
jgi:hypothetical protein